MLTMASADVQTLEQIVEGFLTEPSFNTLVNKIRVVGGGNGHCVCEMTVEERHQNQAGTLHGGATALLVDFVSTVALKTSEKSARSVSVELSVSYPNSAKVGEDIVIEGKVLKAGRKLAFLSVDVTRKSDGVLVAQGKHTKYIL